MYYIGIDPGKTGSVTVLRDQVFNLYPTPIIKLEKNEYDIPEMINLLTPFTQDAFCCIEKSQCMPGNGIVQAFSTGKGYGLWLGILTALQIPFFEVHPRVWTKLLLSGSGGEGKERNYMRARQLFPKWEPKFKYEREYSDSLLLAEYAKRTKQIQ